jgi:hypothetical protein
MPVCGNPLCVQVVSRRSTMDEFAFQQFLRNQKRLLEQTRRLTLQRAHNSRIEAAEDRWLALRLRAQVELSAFETQTQAPFPNDERVTLEIGLPTGPLVTVPADADRREAFRTHLRKVLDEASHQESVLPSDEVDTSMADMALQASQAAACSGNDDNEGNAEASDAAESYGPFSSQLCGVCAGGCCPVGSNHAFVTADTIRRVQSQNEQQRTAEDIEAMYLSFLPEQSQEGGCIYQQANGCALPRDLRGDTCNTYVCDSFRAVQQAEQESQYGAQLPLQAVIVVQRQLNQCLRDKLALNNGITGLAIVRPQGSVLRSTVDDLQSVVSGGRLPTLARVADGSGE